MMGMGGPRGLNSRTGMIRMQHGTQDVSKVQFKKTYFRLLSYAKPYWAWIALVLILSLAGAFVGILPPQVMGVAIDEITGFGSTSLRQDAAPAAPKGPNLRNALPVAPYIHRAAKAATESWLRGIHPTVATALVLVAAFLLLFLVANIFSAVQGIVMSKVGQGLIYDMRSQVYKHVQSLSVRYFTERPTGDVMSRVVNDVNSLDQVIVGPVVSLITDVFRLAWVLVFCLMWDWQLTLLSLMAAPLLILSTSLVGRRLRKYFRLLREKVGDLNALLQDNISGIRVIQSFAREDYELNRFNEKSRENYTLNVRLAKIFAVFRPWIELLNQVGTLVVLGVGSVKVIGGSLNPGMLVVFMQYLPMLFGPVTGFTRFYNFIQQALASCERVFDVLDTKPEIVSPPNAVELPRLRGEVEFQRVSFAYRTEVSVLTDISLRAKPGEMVALVGPSGAGKSTLITLIPRFYDPTVGSILVDGYDLKSVDLTSLRRQIGTVSQDPFLFNDTIRNNLRYGRLDATDEEIIEAAKAANAHEFIMEIPEQYDALIGERGVKLSGGQRQRLSIARAVLADARILILDEATSSVDSETERLIQQAVDRLVRNRTTFVIAHRLSTVQGADQILVLEAGRVVERGTHEELLDQGGLYARLHQVQFRLDSPPPSESAPPPPHERRNALLEFDVAAGNALDNL